MSAERQRISEVYAGYAAGDASDRWSRTNPGYAALAAEREQRLRAAVTSSARQTRALRVLDLGCGSGSDMPMISDAVGPGCQVIGLELRLDALQATARDDSEADVSRSLVNGDACALPFADSVFDVIVLNTVLSSVLDARVRRTIAKEARRVLRAGGEIVVYDMRVGNPSNPDVRRVSLRDLRRLFPDCEFEGSTLTVVSQLARALPKRGTGRLYSALARLPLLRSHRITRVRPVPQRRSVLHVTSAHPPTDPRIFLKECQTLANAGYAVALAAPGAPAEIRDGVELVPMPVRAGRKQRFTRAPFDVNRVVAQRRPDVVHFHDPDLLPISLWWAVRKRRVVYDSHESVGKDMARKPYLSPAVSRVVAPLFGATESMIARRLTHVVAATPAIAAQWPFESTVVANYPMLSEWSGINCTEEGYERRPNRGCYVGVVDDERCTGVMVEAAALVAVEGFELAIAGPLYCPEPAGPGIRYLGVLDRAEVAGLFETSRFGVALFKPNPSFVESMPTKILEYMAAGLPVVVSRSVEVIAAIVLDAGCGIVVDHDDPAAVANAMRRLIDNPADAWHMGQSGRQAVLERYSWSSQAARLLDAYEAKIVRRARTKT